jgi:hypothetical protein
MQIRELYHGTNGDNILRIIRQGIIMPNIDEKIFFSEGRFDSVLMHGPDEKRRSTFALKLRVTIPSEAVLQKTVTFGVDDTLVISTRTPLPVCVLELYIRQPGASVVKIIQAQQRLRSTCRPEAFPDSSRM